MDNERNERRQKMLEKVRKLLNMARDGRGNSNEEETAMRQANKLIAEFGIAEAECDMSEIDAGEMSFGECQCTPDGRAPVAGTVFKTMPGFAGTLALGIGKFTDTIVQLRQTATGPTIIFRGEQQDALLARWLFGVLLASINSEQKASGWTSRSDSALFKKSAVSILYKRLHALHAERQAMYAAAQRESNCRALVVVDRKQMEISRLFGRQHTRTVSSRSSGDREASIAGREAGGRINIPAGRPIGNQSRTMIH